MPIDLSDLFEASNRKTEDAPQPRPAMHAQYMELRARFKLLQEEHWFKPGQFVREKQGLGHTKPESKVAWMFIRYLNYKDDMDRVMIEDIIKNSPMSLYMLGVDCVLAAVTPDSSGTMLHASYSGLLEPVSDAEADEI